MSTSHFSLAGKTAIVTGAGRGLGKAIGLGLASCGADVVLASRTLAELAAVADDCRSFGVRAEPLVTDITASDQCDKLVQFCVSRFGKLDIAVCNARIGIHAPAATMLDEDWAQVMAVSLSGYFNVARSAGRQMITQKGGSIIAVSANSSEVGYSELTASASAKGGVDQMCRNLAVEWGPYAIRVNSINPGYTEHVPSTGEVAPGTAVDHDEDVRIMTPLGRRGSVDEIAWPAVFLASDAASYITGVNLRIDGGYAVK